jgi:hypothetical protein
MKQGSYDDDASASSTLTVELSPQKQLFPGGEDHSEIGTKKENKKRVSFNLGYNQEYKSTLPNKEKVKELWHTKKDFALIRQNTRELEKSITWNGSKSYERVLGLCCRAEYETDVSVASRSDLQPITAWMIASPQALGLEKWNIKSIMDHRARLRNELSDMVLGIQAMNMEGSEEYLRAQAQRITRTSRLYARTLADALAIVLESESDVCSVYQHEMPHLLAWLPDTNGELV